MDFRTARPPLGAASTETQRRARSLLWTPPVCTVPFKFSSNVTESCATGVSSECSNPTLKCTWPPSSLTITTEEHSVPHKARSPLKSVYSPQRQRIQSPLCTGRRTQAAKQLDDPSLQCFTLSADHQTRTPNPVKPNFDPTISVCPTAKQLDGRTMLIQAPGKTSPRPRHSPPTSSTATAPCHHSA